MQDLIDYLIRCYGHVRVVAAAIISAICYVLFPEPYFMAAFFATGGAILFDIYTRYRAESRKAGGWGWATICGLFRSDAMWAGTRIKLEAYLVIFILAGLSYRIAFLAQLSIYAASVVYTVIFLREFQSCTENLIEAGADLHWLLFWTKREQARVLQEEVTNHIEQQPPAEGGGIR